MGDVSQRLNRVRARIVQAAQKVDRDPSEIKLVAVSKGVNLESLKKALGCGLKVFGENRVQEFTKKYKILGSQAEWHFVGHLQRNKAKHLVGKVSLLHSLDSFELAKLLDKLAEKQDQPWRVLVQVNVSREATKHGIEPSELEQFLEAIQDLKGVQVWGLMAIAPYCPDPEEVRPFFRGLRELKERVMKKKPWLGLKHLSMGMSGDFEVAIEEGATLVRIGSALFGS